MSVLTHKPGESFVLGGLSALFGPESLITERKSKSQVRLNQKLEVAIGHMNRAIVSVRRD